MLELKNIKKIYTSGNEKLEALKGINLKFRNSEFVSILGQSGCGKTTLLNIIGGLDRYTSGDLIINGKSTKKFKDRDWDAYRNYKIGFIFQSYNLIGHQTVLSNVELALTIGGISKKERKKRAIKALEDVGLKEHIHKKPNQLSGGQMQRVAIARALVNNPDIILADEPTGALDTKTSVQVMDILKEISKDKLIIMVTHNPELAEKYSSRIIKILDGVITEDSNPIIEEIEEQKIENKKMKRTSMSIFTAFRLSLNNLLTKKGRTILVSFAGSIGIIGIALVLSVSNGFQAYVDKIQEDALTSYPLTIMQESTDLASALLSMTSEDGKNEDQGEIKEEQYISKMLASLSTNDLKSFKNYINSNNESLKDDILSTTYGYSVEPTIYTKEKSGKISKINPSDLFSSSFGSGMGMSFGSTFSQMIDNEEIINNSYDILEGRLPTKYNEMLIVLSERNSISDFLLYSLGIRPVDELNDIVTKIMSGEKVELENEPMKIQFSDLLNTELKLIMPTDKYKYNEKYDIYEEITEDEKYLEDIYNKALDLKIVGVVTAKEGITTTALKPGVSYRSDLIDYIIDYSKETDIIKKQIENKEIDVLSGARFDTPKNDVNLDFADLVGIDNEKLQSAFNIKIDKKQMQSQTQGYMLDISNSISTDITPAQSALQENLNILSDGLFKSIDKEINVNEVDNIVENYVSKNEPNTIFKNLENKYVIPKDTFKATYSGLLKGLLQVYITSYYTANKVITQNSSNTKIPNIEDFNINDLKEEDKKNIEENLDEEKLKELEKYKEMLEAQNKEKEVEENKEKLDTEDNLDKENKEEITYAKIDDNMVNVIKSSYISSPAIIKTIDTMAKVMTEAVVKKNVLTKVGELTSTLTNSFASAFNVDQEKIASAFKLKITEEEITRIVTAMVTKKEVNAKTNLISLGYQDKDEPTYISFYFKSFEGKENFKNFIEKYNEKVKKDGEEEKEINYTDTTGILMGSVKTIVNAVTYVLIAFISISLVVSSMMIGIITYISVYERTKEIGILRAIGASKHNISSIFNAETFIIGLLSGLFGIGVTYLLIPIINNILHYFTGNIPLNVTFYAKNAIILVVLSIILTLIGGIIPSKAASKKDPVIALRTE